MITKPRTRTRPDLCAGRGHPGVTYHPQHDQTWCLCGEVIRDGDKIAMPHMACCGGPLEEVITEGERETVDLVGALRKSVEAAKARREAAGRAGGKIT